jgi:hypothetical protein
MLRKIGCAIALGAAIVACMGCGVEVGADYPAGYYGDYPPDGYIYQRRMQGAPVRRMYESPGRSAGHSGGRSGGRR